MTAVTVGPAVRDYCDGMNRPFVRDHTLRLVFAKGHEEWLADRWRYHVVCLGLAVAGLLLGFAAPVIDNPILAFHLVLTPAWLVAIVMALVDLRRVRRWRVEHRAFLATYNRS